MIAEPPGDAKWCGIASRAVVDPKSPLLWCARTPTPRCTESEDGVGRGAACRFGSRGAPVPGGGAASAVEGRTAQRPPDTKAEPLARRPGKQCRLRCVPGT